MYDCKETLFYENVKFYSQGHRLKTYSEEIRILREERDDESLRERDLVRNIIAIWKEIRNLRTTQKYNNTAHKIIIHKVC